MFPLALERVPARFNHVLNSRFLSCLGGFDCPTHFSSRALGAWRMVDRADSASGTLDFVE